MRTGLALIVLGLNVADLALTLWLLRRRPGAYEANPLLRPLSGRPWLFGAVKVAVMAGLVFWLWQAPGGLWALGLLALGYVGVVAWNVRQLKA